MDVVEWLWALNELFKCFLIICGILGFSYNRRWRIRNLIFFITGSFVFSHFFYWAQEQFALLGIFIFIIFFLSGTLLEKVKVFLIAELTLSAGDLFMANLLSIVFPSINILKAPFFFDFVFDIFWVLLVILLYKYRKIVYEYFVKLSVLWFGVLFAILFGVGLMTGIMHHIINNGITEKYSNGLLLVYTSVMLLLFIAGGVFIYYVVSKKNLSMLMEQEKEKYFLEKKYYEGKIKKNEEIQRFQHDMKKHMKIIRQLCDEIPNSNCQIERLREYVETYLDTYPEQAVVYTGNIISDYFISELINALSTNDEFRYDVMGKLPSEIVISDADLSILLGNALDNAREELLKIDGACYFRIVFKNYNDKIMIKIENTRLQYKEKNVNSDGHGYGIKNMREVVNRYNGTLEIIESVDSFSVDIFI